MLVSLAIIAVASMSLFSNLNLNLMGRMSEFRKSRLDVVNSRFAESGIINSALNPLTWLDYAPNTGITPGGGVPTDPGLDPGAYEDPSISQAEVLLSEADDIINIVLPYKVNKAYYIDLGGNNNDYSHIINNVSLAQATEARDLCNEMLQKEADYSNYGENMSAQRAYDDFFEDMNGTDADGDEFLGAIGLFQQALDEPMPNGPFDPDVANEFLRTQNANNRIQLQNTINSLRSAEPGLNLFLNGSPTSSKALKPILKSARNQLNAAVDDDHWEDTCSCGLYCEYWCRYDHIIAAKAKLKELIDFVGEVESARPSSDLAAQIQQATALLQPEVTSDEANRALGLCNDMLADPEMHGDPTATPPIPPPTHLVGLLTDARDNLNLAIENWSNETLRNYYLGLAEQKMEILNDIVD